ncbi:MAG TPA: hypothetical protein QGH10_07945 [Armatimonadota bacterium]|nr:hypothetical protein [Armatimonadota bacterium]
MTGLLFILLTSPVAADDAPLLVRARNFLVPPSTGPVTHVVVKNTTDAPYASTLSVQFADGWEVTPSQHEIALQPGETKMLPFTIKGATDLAANAYPIAITIDDAPPIAQTVTCASAPYFQPKIDGKLNEWDDAIPMALSGATLRTYWNKREFCLAVEVEETELTDDDAVQFALAAAASDHRYEFLVTGQGKGATCSLLSGPAPQPAEGAQVAVKHQAGVTRHEIAIPFALMGDIRPTPGREICFSLLIHDPDGTGLRDLGDIMNLWPEHRSADAWADWASAVWPETPPWTSRIEFGLCSSIH